MNYYLSSPTSVTPLAKNRMLESEEPLNFLLSFALDAKGNFEKYYQQGKNHVLIDSGAFSAWNSGKVINREEYLAYIKKLPSEVSKINLDVIPRTGSSQGEKIACCQASFENFLYLNKHVKNVLPVHHYGEDISWAHKMLDHTDHICISPANDTAESVKRTYFRYIWEELDFSVKTHVLGYTSIKGSEMFPFYSVDSISYKAPMLFGNVLIERVDGSIIQSDLKTFAKHFGYEYDSRKPMKEQKDLLGEATWYHTKVILNHYKRITESHKTKDFSYLKSQLSLF